MSKWGGDRELPPGPASQRLQSAILERETGIELSRATLDGWVMRVGELLSPIVAAICQELLKGDYIQADKTPGGCADARWQRPKIP